MIVESMMQARKLVQNEEAVMPVSCGGVDEAWTALNERYGLLISSPNVASAGEVSRGPGLRTRAEAAFLGQNERIWRRLPPRVIDLGPVRTYGRWLHALVCRRADREMYLGTSFLRNRPALELIRRLADEKEPGATFKIAVMGCSIGAEVYSILWTLRSSRPDLELEVQAVDIAPEVVQVAERGIYSPSASAMVGSSIFDGLTAAEREEMFDWEGDEGTIKPWLRAGVTWHTGDAADPNLATSLGRQDLVVANNFLCHMSAHAAQSCLRNLAQLVSPGGYLLVTGIDPDVRTKVALELGWEPIPELRAEIHDGDALVRRDWPWRWWGLEPLDQRRPDWETRYSAVFRTVTNPSTST